MVILTENMQWNKLATYLITIDLDCVLQTSIDLMMENGFRRKWIQTKKGKKQMISSRDYDRCEKTDYQAFLAYIYIYHHHHHHHHVVPLIRISLTLSRHFSLSFIASGRSSGLHPVSSHSCSSCFCPVICGGP